MRASKNGTKGSRHGQGNTEAAPQSETEAGNVATMTRMSDIPAHSALSEIAPTATSSESDPVIEARKMMSDVVTSQRVIGQRLMSEYKATDQRLREIGATMLEMGMIPPPSLTGVRSPSEGKLKIDGRSKEARALRVATKAPKIDGRSKEARALRESASKGVKLSSNSAKVLALVQKYAPSKTKAKTKKELREYAVNDAKFSGIDDTSLNTGLQANRPPKVKIPRIGLTPTPGGNARGGKYYAMV